MNKLSIFTLDANAIEHVDLFEECTTKWAKAVQERDKIKEQLARKKAEIDEDIRKHPKKYGWNSETKAPTETWFALKNTLHPEIKKLSDDLISHQFEVNSLLGKKETLEQRGKRLDNLIDLYKGNYFAAKSRGNSNYQEKITEGSEETQIEGLNKSSRFQKPIKRTK